MIGFEQGLIIFAIFRSHGGKQSGGFNRIMAAVTRCPGRVSVTIWLMTLVVCVNACDLLQFSQYGPMNGPQLGVSGVEVISSSALRCLEDIALV